MRRFEIILLAIAFGITLTAAAAGQERSGAERWRDQFAVDKAKLADKGRNSFFILEPGYKLEMTAAGGDERKRGFYDDLEKL